MGDTVQIISREDSDVVRRFEVVNVYLKHLWSDEWEIAPFIEPISATVKVGAGNSAVLRFRYGAIVWPEIKTWQTYTAYDLNDWFVQLRTTSTEGKEIELFTGMIIEDSTIVHGSDATEHTGDQMFQAAGLEYLLSKKIITAAVVNENGTETIIEHVPPMNIRQAGDIGLQGNRTTNPNGNSIYRYSSDGAEWTHYQYLAMILYDYRPYYYAADGTLSYIPFYGSGQVELLNEIITTQNIEGLSVVQLLDRLIDRRRGFGWRIGHVGFEASSSIPIEVFSVFSDTITVGDTTITANPAQVSIDFGNTADTQGVNFRFSSGNQYNAIKVRGERIVSCFSMEGSDLTEGWTSAEETAYKAGASAATGYAGLSDAQKRTINDEFRSNDRFARVYRNLILSKTWNWQDYNSHFVNLAVDYQGTITGVQGAYWNHSKKLLRHLPLKEGFDYYTGDSPVDNNPTGTIAEQLSPLVWLKYNGKYHQADRLAESINGAPSMSVRPLDTELGLVIGARPNHLLALNHWSGVEPSEWYAVFDYDELVCTIAVETDQRLEVTAASAEATETNWRQLVIDVPGCELWYVCPDTYVGVDANGALQTYACTNELRNDKAKLQAIAAAALGWYGKKRQVLTAKLSYLFLSAQPGTLITSVLNNKTRQQVNTILSEVNYDFESGSSGIMTAYAELDWAGMGVSFTHPDLGDSQALAKTIVQQSKRIQRLEQEQKNKPVREGGIITQDGFWAIIGANVAETANRKWRYAWQEAALSNTGYGNLAAKSGGRSGTTSSDAARNMLENGNPATGTLMNGATTANLDTDDYTFTPQPCPSGAIVWMRPVVEATTNTTTYWFEYANGLDGSCD